MAEQLATSSSSFPPSPGVSRVRLSDCIEELLRFTLSTQELPLGLGLSKEYCSCLLQFDEAQETIIPNPNPIDCRGVPTYPLYKHLARALERLIKTGTFLRERHFIDSIPVLESLKARGSEWNELIVEKGSEILNMLEAVDFQLHVQEPYFSQLRDGLKKVEGRCAVGDYNRIAPGALLFFNKCLLLEVQHVNRYSSFSEMLKIEGLSSVLPGVETIEEGVQVYRNFYSREKENSNGVLAVSVSKPASQPYMFLASILNGLNYDGIGDILGMMHTAGTVPNALPPSRASLVASALRLHHPNLEVKGCLLTNAARALAKHASRSSEGWWGNLCGNDSHKNKLASEVINRLLNDCCWMNIHFIQPNNCVFEVRVLEGYGARWSADGTKFIGFLEPHTEEGYSEGCRH